MGFTYAEIILILQQDMPFYMFQHLILNRKYHKFTTKRQEAN